METLHTLWNLYELIMEADVWGDWERAAVSLVACRLKLSQQNGLKIQHKLKQLKFIQQTTSKCQVENLIPI